MTDIVEQLQNLFIDNPPGKSRVGVSAEIVVNKVVEAVAEIVRLREYHQDALKQLATTRDERDRLRDALRQIRHYAVRLGAAWAEARARVALKGDTPS